MKENTTIQETLSPTQTENFFSVLHRFTTDRPIYLCSLNISGTRSILRLQMENLEVEMTQ